MMKKKKNVKSLFSKDILKMLSQFFTYNFSMAKIFFMVRVLIYQTVAAFKRNCFGFDIPAILIISITSECNLKCADCYSKVHHADMKQAITTNTFTRTVTQAKKLGVSIAMIAGGEPLLRFDILQQAARYKSILFPVFTNATLFDDEKAGFFKKNRHCIPIVSIEGDAASTDFRRGDTISKFIDNAVALLNKYKTIWGFSITLQRSNFDHVLSSDFIKYVISTGAVIIFMVEFVSVSVSDEDKTLSKEQHSKLQQVIAMHQKNFRITIISLPGDETKYGGCLAAGRGFLHVNPEGDVEACPFAPFSDGNISELPLTEALTSPLMKKIRQNHDKLTETSGGCALWANREWVQQHLIHTSEKNTNT